MDSEIKEWKGSRFLSLYFYSFTAIFIKRLLEIAYNWILVVCYFSIFMLVILLTIGHGISFTELEEENTSWTFVLLMPLNQKADTGLFYRLKWLTQISKEIRLLLYNERRTISETFNFKNTMIVQTLSLNGIIVQNSI